MADESGFFVNEKIEYAEPGSKVALMREKLDWVQIGFEEYSYFTQVADLVGFYNQATDSFFVSWQMILDNQNSLPPGPVTDALLLVARAAGQPDVFRVEVESSGLFQEMEARALPNPVLQTIAAYEVNRALRKGSQFATNREYVETVREVLHMPELPLFSSNYKISDAEVAGLKKTSEYTINEGLRDPMRAIAQYLMDEVDGAFSMLTSIPGQAADGFKRIFNAIPEAVDSALDAGFEKLENLLDIASDQAIKIAHGASDALGLKTVAMYLAIGGLGIAAIYFLLRK